MEQVNLDVSELPAPEPFEQITLALVALTKEQYLKVSHRKQPLPLYRALPVNGYEFHVQKGSKQAFDIFIWHESQPSPEGLIQPSIADTSNTQDKCS